MNQKIKLILSPLLAVLLLAPSVLLAGSPQTLKQWRAQRQQQKLKQKLAADLQAEVTRLDDELTVDKLQRVIIKFKDSASMLERQIMLTQRDGQMNRSHDNVGVVSALLPLSRIRELAADGVVDYVSPDRPAVSLGHIENTIGAPQVRAEHLF